MHNKADFLPVEDPNKGALKRPSSSEDSHRSWTSERKTLESEYRGELNAWVRLSFYFIGLLLKFSKIRVNCITRPVKW